ncbi:MAG TPA: VOC family protein [Streptosporangiaceae bacterium]|nr:VOC family protein [Streptosporangiaceae bacterium]
MDESGTGKLTRQEISDVATGWGWRLLRGALVTQVAVESLADAADLAARLTSGVGCGRDQELRLDVRDGRLILTLQSAVASMATRQEVELAHRISAFVSTLGLSADAAGAGRPAQLLEIGIDALDMAAIRPFWKAILGYVEEPEPDDPPNGIADPDGQGPSIWFQQMDAPRPQRNRIHLDITVPHDEAQRRIEAAIAAGGTLRYDAEAPAFWVLADAEGNEACITTWQGRDQAAA